MDTVQYTLSDDKTGMSASAAILEPNANFPFEHITFVSPVPVAGGNHFIRCFGNAKQTPLYIQPPKCKTKAGIVKTGSGKGRMYCDLVFTHDDEEFLEWITQFELICQEKIYQSREKWFESSLEKHDIENSFSQTMKMFKSGKMYTMRVQIPMRLGKCALKVYNEQEEDVVLDSIQEQTNLVTILEFQGIKCSSRNFQLEVEVKQMMVLNPVDVFERCMFRKPSNQMAVPHVAVKQPNLDLGSDNTPVVEEESETERLDVPVLQLQPDIQSGAEHGAEHDAEPDTQLQPDIQPVLQLQSDVQPDMEPVTDLVLPETTHNDFVIEDVVEEEEEESEIIVEPESDLCEVDIPLDTIDNEEDVMKLKDRNAVYYEMYREAKRKAQIARDLAVASYLEAKRIKNTYHLDFHGLDTEEEEAYEKTMNDLDEFIPGKI